MFYARRLHIRLHVSCASAPYKIACFMHVAIQMPTTINIFKDIIPQALLTIAIFCSFENPNRKLPSMLTPPPPPPKKVSYKGRSSASQPTNNSSASQPTNNSSASQPTNQASTSNKRVANRIGTIEQGSCRRDCGYPPRPIISARVRAPRMLLPSYTFSFLYDCCKVCC